MSEKMQLFNEWQVYLSGKSKDSGHIRAPVGATPGALWVMLQEGKWVSNYAVDDEVYMMWETSDVLRFEYSHKGSHYDIKLVLFDVVEIEIEKTIQKTEKAEKYDRFSLSKQFIQEKINNDEGRTKRISRRRKDDAFKKPARKFKARPE